LSGEPVELAIEMARDQDGRPASGAGIRLATYDRVIRIVSYTFFMVTAVVVAVSGLWPDSAPAIYLLLLAGTATIFLLHELAPRVADVESLFLIEGAAGVTFFTLLVMLTGGVASPFFFGYFLVVAAAALVTGGGASLVLAAAITAAYLGGLLVTRAGSPFASQEIVVVAVNVMALWLLSYLASVVAGEQRRTRDAALRLSLHDPLTRLFNRTFLFAVIEREIARAGRTNRRFSLLMLDLDGLKPINDRFGHYFGDRMLQAVAEAVRQGIRVIDTAARYGGDEFVVLLPETDTEGAAVVAEKLRRSVAAIRLNAGTDVLRSTISIGVVAFPDDGRTADALTNRADQVMYGAKRAGRDRVLVEGHDAIPLVGRRGVASTLAVAAVRGSAMPPRMAVAPPSVSVGTGAQASDARRSPARARPSRPRRAQTTRAAASRSSMFTESYPPLPPWAQARPASWTWTAGSTGRAGGAVAPTTSSSMGATDQMTDSASPPIASAGDVAIPSRSSRAPTTRARRFFVDHPDDRTFERTMRLFLPGTDDSPHPKGVDLEDPGG
jgi:diguanylate cyclase (GGDEF)-like protein